MDEEDLINSLGTIARSGTKVFLEQFNKSKDDKKEDVNLIGQFGVGFYASFMAMLVFSSFFRITSTKFNKLLYTFFYWISDNEKRWMHYK